MSVLTPARATYQVGPQQEVTLDLFYVTDDAHVPEMLEWMRAQKAVGFDLETGGLDPLVDRIATMQIGNPTIKDPRAYVVDMRCVSDEALRPVFDLLESRALQKLGQNVDFECRFMQASRGVRLRGMADCQVAELVLRAGLFPISKMRGADGGIDRKAYGETSMKRLCSFYLGIDIEKDKDLRTSFDRTKPGEHNESQLHYAAGDVVYPFYIARKQRRIAQERGLLDILKIEFALIPILADAHLYGIGIDKAAWRALWQVAKQKLSTTQKALDSLLLGVGGQQEMFARPNERPLYPKNGKAINYDSPEQIKWVIVEHCRSLGWAHEVVTSKKRLLAIKKEFGQNWLNRQRELGRKKTDEDIPDWVIPTDRFCLLLDTKKDTIRLARLRKQLPDRLCELLVEYSKWSIRVDTFGIEFLNKHVQEDGRIHPKFHQCITSTGRLSTEPNSQNIPREKEYRQCFKPRKGYKYVIADYSQIEPRLSAQVSQDPVYLSAFLEAKDIYVKVAEAMLGHEVDKKTPDGKLKRTIFKIVVLALAYRQGVAKLMDTLTLGLEKEILAEIVECPTFEYTRDLWQRFFKVHAGLAEYQDLCSNLTDFENESAQRIWDDYLGCEVTWIAAPCGRKRFFPPGSSTYTEGPNAPIQGCSATITKAAAVLVQEHIDEYGLDAHVINLVHDEIVWEVREDQAEAFAPVAKALMEKAGKQWLPDVPVIAEFPEGSKGVVDAWLKEVE